MTAAGRTQLAALDAPVLAGDPALDSRLLELEEISQELTRHTHSAGTRLAYGKAWRSFETFCTEHHIESLPAHPQAVRWYVAWMSDQLDGGRPRFAVSTIRQHLAGIADAHVRAGLLDPTRHRGVSDLVRGLSSLRAVRPRRERPLLTDDVLRIIEAMPHDIHPAGVSAARDSVAIWLGFVGALRRSEAAALRLSSLELHVADGIHVHVGASKADQHNTDPDVVVLPYGGVSATCAPCAIHRWVRLVTIADSDLDASATRRQLMRAVFDYRQDHHVCGLDGQGLISSADLGSRAPLLRATYRNRRAATIRSEGVTGDALHSMLKTRMHEAGLSSTAYGFHSLRAGHVTQARRNGARTEEIMRAGRWHKAETVTGYDREHNPAVRNSVNWLGLAATPTR